MRTRYTTVENFRDARDMRGLEIGKEQAPVMLDHRKTERRRRQRGIAIVALLTSAIAACSADPNTSTSKAGEAISGFVGGVSGDEPRATLVAQDVLASGGTAADAAVAMTFALSVTYPAAAALGGGGSCLIFDAATQSSETLNFLPVHPAGGGSIAVPGTVRGLAALHSRYGRKSWRRLLEPAEHLARRGHPVSRALAKVLQAARPVILSDMGLKSIFVAEGGHVMVEGDPLSQVPLSAVLAQIRVRGPGEFYVGQAANNLIAGARVAGSAMAMTDLRNYRPSWHETSSMKMEGLVYHTSPGPMIGGTIAGQMWAMLSEEERFAKSVAQKDGVEKAHLLAEVSARAYSDRGANVSRPLSTFRAHAMMTSYRPERHVPGRPEVTAKLSPDLGLDSATGFAIVDQEGSAVACTLSMGRSFGAGRADRLTGVVLAAPMVAGDLDFLGPIIVVSNEGRLVMAAAAVGGPAAPAALAQGALTAINSGKDLVPSIDATRVFHPNNPDQVHVEPDMNGAVVAALRQRGHTLRVTDKLGRVNAILCPGGLGPDNQKCQFRADPRGYGLAAGGDF